EEQELNLKQQFEQYAYYWKWFILSTIICVFCAFVYLRYAQKVYNINAKILLQDEKQASGEMAGLTELANLTGVGNSSAAFVNDQMEILRSRRLMRKVVDTNRLYFSYHVKGKIKSAEVLETNAPLKVTLLDPDHPKLDSIGYSFVLNKQGDSYKIRDDFEGSRLYHLGSRLETPIGPIRLDEQEG